MFRLIVLSCLLATGFASSLDGKIVGGDLADIREVPYQVSFGYNGHYHICGGSILDEYTILTAAHCTDRRADRLRDMTIRAGSSDYLNGGQLIYVDKYIQHESFNKSISMNHDIALLKLKSPLQFSESVRPINTEEWEVPAGAKSVVSGWGSTKAQIRASTQYLYKVTLDVISYNNCVKRYFSRMTENMICTLTENKDSCQGDSGGPLTADGLLIGIVSWGIGCADPKYPGVYTKVSNYNDWIQRNI